jgi:hypothetical protein
MGWIRKEKDLDFWDRRERQERGTCLRRTKLSGVEKKYIKYFYCSRLYSMTEINPVLLLLLLLLYSPFH